MIIKGNLLTGIILEVHVLNFFPLL